MEKKKLEDECCCILEKMAERDKERNGRVVIRNN
jgi:hypothetical protein